MPIPDNLTELFGPDPVTTGKHLMPSDPRYDQIIEALKTENVSYLSIARRFGVGINQVRRLAFQNGIRHDQEERQRGVREATKMSVTYAKERRIALLDRAFEKVEALIDEAVDPKEMRDVVASLGTLIDKRRLEDGEATSRTESLQAQAKETLSAKIDDLSKRREAKRQLDQNRNQTKGAKQEEAPAS